MSERLERGGDDRRLLPVAIALWASCLIAREAFSRCMALFAGRNDSGEGGFGGEGSSVTPIIAVCVVTIAVLLVWIVAERCARRGVGRMLIVVCVGAFLLGVVTTWASESAVWFDPATIRARDGPVRVTARLRVIEPVETSSMRDADCQAETRLVNLDDGAVATRSHAQVRLLVSGADCGRLHRGAGYRVSGELREAELGATPLWLTVSGDDDDTATDAGASGSMPDMSGIRMTERQPLFDRWRERVQEAFFHATDGLDDSGRILVPGLTMGFLGQDHVGIPESDSAEDSAEDSTEDSTTGDDPIDETYASRLEDCFRRAGIMHLMAVSGGHFVIVAALIRRVGAYLLMPRQAVACLTAISTTLMAAMMAPGDSVTRALVMGWLSAAALFVGRRSQALSALCVTVIVMLLTAPALAWSFGFALSCAAVLGIILMARPMAAVMALLLPDALADAIAMTVAAQVATLPIQVLMEPQLPIWSVPANILVAPVVAFSTMTGLAGLAVAWANMDAARLCAWLSSWGTRIMEQVAMRLGDGNQATIPWMEGVAGACAIVVLEAATIVGIRLVCRWISPPSGAHMLLGDPFTSNPRNRLRLWWQDTHRMISKLTWS
ncbi:ComEC/Rec2 family competence protein [Bifidobacterium stellenboschense]|uniref:Competence protein n=1 Tax=Bifidobacterium stellenboschense TaxID=762211 RepID=A0A087E0P4_9BIFI|nr:ComEC/Rec2 family competence protein [Bifidobacterium stellenboschense]KFJ01345.1 competence protein [Bifidobacterium stellenboschense]